MHKTIYISRMPLISYYTIRLEKMQAKGRVIYVNSVDEAISTVNWGCEAG
jgi:hypothetical protein